MRGDPPEAIATPARPSCSTSSGSPDSSIAPSGRSRVASSSASPSRAHLPPSRASSCSTSRSARSTGAFAIACSTTSHRVFDELGLTAVYVTHDQTEAFALGDRVAVMRDGRVVQVGDAGRALGAARSTRTWLASSASRTSTSGEVVRPEAVRVRRATGDGDGRRRERRADAGRSCASWSGSTTGAGSRRSTPRSSTRRRATGSTSTSTRRASFASDDPAPRRRPRARAGRVLPRHGSRGERSAPASRDGSATPTTARSRRSSRASARPSSGLSTLCHKGPRGARVDRVEVATRSRKGSRLRVR